MRDQNTLNCDERQWKGDSKGADSVPYLQFEAFPLEAGDDVAHKPTLDAVGLDHDVGAFGVGHDDLRWVVGLVGRKKRSCYKC